MKIRIIRNRHGSAEAALSVWSHFVWGNPIQLGPDKWHVYGAHRRRGYKLVNVEFTSQRIVISLPARLDTKKAAH